MLETRRVIGDETPSSSSVFNYFQLAALAAKTNSFM
jgi:hypothetical protein